MQIRVTTGAGVVEGASQDGISRFLGVPFAAPPVGDLRWRAPQPAPHWRGVRQATDFGPSAPQAPSGGLQRLIGISGGPTDEDCLYLNVWTPAVDGRARPVLFWIHGGANTVGSGAQPRINGEHLARRGDVVVVTFNYRLGALGFLHAPELGASGNEALLDQIAALQWVRDNIAAFGGDPDNVTAFGQSAGGFDLVALMAMESAAGLFHKAGPMSGSLGLARTPTEAQGVADALAERFGGYRQLRAVPAADILAWQLETGHAYGAVEDGDWIADDIATVIGEGRYTRGMPMLIGTCEHESALWTAMDRRGSEMTDDDFARRVKELDAARAPALIDAYRTGRTPIEAWTAINTDRMFRLPAIRTADKHRQHTPEVWSYLFDYRSPAMDGQLGSVHSLDIPFVFGTLSAEGMDQFCGSGAEVVTLSGRMMDMWLAFARDGDPGHSGLPAWPRRGDALETMRLGLDPHLEADPLGAERRAWAAP